VKEGEDRPTTFKFRGAANTLVVLKDKEAIYTNDQANHYHHTKPPQNSWKKSQLTPENLK
jgi:hypothetical protein